MEYLLIALVSYVLGSIPFGFILTKIFLKKDIRNIGSGNIGATNALRTGNKALGYTTLALDIAKAVIPVLFVKFNYPEYVFIASLSAFLGHVFPVWLKFKGGKGVATFIGITLALYWPAGILTCLTWILIAYISRISSLSALLSSISSIVWIWICGMPNATFIMIILTIFIWVRHKENIKRIIKNTEPRINS